ncbi:uncharacterized protein LOC127129596 [Lathyrus oleraceus]|uniref:uncharacterized protein LOC127129596 n=1 Tax=Pisum sativum TaxID=3888 RepID=UPI0021D1061E|nr:uncharacterized protein LOC127129596 [Pisum sativum]
MAGRRRGRDRPGTQNSDSEPPSGSEGVSQEATGGSFLDFFRMNPHEFHGGMNPVKAQEWITSMERIFQIVHCSEENKVVFSSHMMKGAAVRWWESASTLMTNQGVPTDWEHFKTIFLYKYFPSSLRTQKEFEFQQLSLMKVQEERDQYRSGQRDQGRPGSQFRPRSQAFKEKQVQHARPNQPPRCQVCKKPHFGRCVGSGVRCFTCQREGHMSRECPQNKNQMQGRSTCRVYTLDSRKAKRIMP